MQVSLYGFTEIYWLKGFEGLKVLGFKGFQGFKRVKGRGYKGLGF